MKYINDKLFDDDDIYKFDMIYIIVVYCMLYMHDMLLFVGVWWRYLGWYCGSKDCSIKHIH